MNFVQKFRPFFWFFFMRTILRVKWSAKGERSSNVENSFVHRLFCCGCSRTHQTVFLGLPLRNDVDGGFRNRHERHAVSTKLLDSIHLIIFFFAHRTRSREFPNTEKRFLIGGESLLHRSGGVFIFAGNSLLTAQLKVRPPMSGTNTHTHTHPGSLSLSLYFQNRASSDDWDVMTERWTLSFWRVCSCRRGDEAALGRLTSANGVRRCCVAAGLCFLTLRWFSWSKPARPAARLALDAFSDDLTGDGAGVVAGVVAGVDVARMAARKAASPAGACTLFPVSNVQHQR